MRTVNFASDIVYGIAHLVGVDPENDLLKDHVRSWVNAINSRVRYGWEFWDWPELTVTEERAFRQIWLTDVTYTAGQGENSELYYIPNETYYRVTGAPAAGVLPTDTNHFEEIASDELDRHIAYEQWGKQDIGQIYAVYGSSPRTFTPALPWVTAPSGLGLDVSVYAGNTVWITYKPRPPQFTSATYSDTTAYTRGNLVLDLDSGDCYIALAAGTGKALNLSAYWLKQEFPYILSEYVKYAVASDMSDDVQQKSLYLTQAEQFLTREVDKNMEQGESHSYGGNKFPVRWPLGTTNFLWSINPPVTT